MSARSRPLSGGADARQRLRGALGRAALPLGLAGLVAVGCLLQLFWGRDVGLADNGDGTRLMCQVRLQADPTLYFRSAQFHYGPAGAQVLQSCLGSPVWRYPSSWVAVLAPAVGLERLLTGSRSFDLRTLGLVSSVLLGGAVGVLAAALRPRGARPWTALGWVALVAAGLLAVDLSWTAYFSAPYAEAGGFTGLLVLLGVIGWTAGRRLGLPGIAALVVAGLAVGTVKAQLTPVAVLVAALLLLAALRRRGTADRRARVVAVAAAGLVLVGSVGYLASAGSEFRDVNRYDLLFATVLHDSPDPQADLTDLGLPVELARFAGTTAFSTSNAFSDPAYTGVADRFGRVQALRFWVTHPDRGVDVLTMALRQVSAPRLDYLSDVVQDPAAPQVVEHRLDLATRLLTALGRLGPWGLPVLWVFAAAAGTLCAVGRRRARSVRRAGAAVAVLAVVAASQVVVALLGDGYYELRKHLVFSGYCTALLVPLLAVLATALAGDRAPRRSPLAVRPGSSPVGARA